MLNQYKPEFLFSNKLKKIIKELRDLGEETILSRLKEIKEENFVASDLLAEILKANGKLKYLTKTFLKIITF